MDCGLFFSHSTMASCFSWLGFVLKACVETLEMLARTLGLQREQLRVQLSIPDSNFSDRDSGLSHTHSVAGTLFEECREVARVLSLKYEQVRFNKSLCRLLVNTYSRSLRSNFDFKYANKCETILAELRRVMWCGEMLVEQWTDKNWWMSVISSSDSVSIKERVVLHLNEFLFCVQVLKLIASNGVVPDGTFFRPLHPSTPDVEEASRRDIESSCRTVEGYKGTSVRQGAAGKLADYVLDEFCANTSDCGHLRMIEYDDVKLERLVGRGALGTVFECQWLGVRAAAKIFRVEVSKLEAETKLHASLQHPNVVHVIGYAIKGSQHVIVLELMSMDLQMYIENVHDQKYSYENDEALTGPLPLLLAIDIMLQIAEGMKYLHQRGVMHRDLKPSNVLINVVESRESHIPSSLEVKIADFGLAKLNLDNSMFTSMGIGTTLWRAPEVVEDEQNTATYTKAADVFSFAMVFFQVITGELPFANIRRYQISQLIRDGVRPVLPPEDYCPAYLSAVIHKCWATMPQDRPNFPEICQMLLQCKGKILSHSSPHSSPQKSEPQDRRNDSGDSVSILATDSDFRDPHSIKHDDVHIEKECLGIGGYGSVFKCQFRGQMAAAKLFLTSKIDQVNAVENEANLLARLQHRNVVQYIGYAVKGREHIIVTELMSKDMRMYLDENVHKGQDRPPLSLLLVVDIMLQIAEAMNYLHESGVMHRDLKANNVLINVVEEKDSNISPSVQVKVTDFGMSKLNLNNSRFTTMKVGQAQWRAPEVFEDEQNTEKYTKAADVYSFAMVFFEVLTGREPFANIEKAEILPRIRRGERPVLPPDDYCPLHLSEVIEKCWATRAEDRPQFPEICKMLVSCKDKILSHSSPDLSSQGMKMNQSR